MSKARIWFVLCLFPAAPALAQSQLVYTPLNPCRIVDTRLSPGGRLAAGTDRTFHVVGSASDFASQGGTAGGCGIPGFGPGPAPQTVAVAFNFVAVNPSGAGNLRAWASDQTIPNASILNYAQVTGLNIANSVIVPVRQDSEGNDLTVRADVSDAHLVVDVVGFFKPLALTQTDLPVVPIARGGTGSTVQNFVDLTSSQTVAGSKAFTDALHANAGLTTNIASVTGTLTTGSPGLVPIVSHDSTLRLLRGVITGSTCTIQFGTGFTCTRNSVGNYTITFTPGFAGLPLPNVTTAARTLIDSLTINNTSMAMTTTNAAGTAADSIFAFTILGPR